MLMGSARGTHACWNACSVTRLPPGKGQGRTKHCTEHPAVSTTPPPRRPLWETGCTPSALGEAAQAQKALASWQTPNYCPLDPDPPLGWHPPQESA